MPGLRIAIGINLGSSGGPSGGAVATILLDNEVDNLDQTPPAYSFDSDTAGTCTWDFHSSATAPAIGAGDIATGTFSVVAGANNTTIDLTGYEEEVGYIHFRVTSGGAFSNTLTSQVITVSGVQTSPTVSGFTPADESTPQLTTPLEITFSEKMKTTGTAAVVTVKKVSDDSTVVTYDPDTQGTWGTGDTVWTGPAVSWTDGEAVYVNYSGFVDLVDNAVTAVSDKTTWNFTPQDETIVETYYDLTAAPWDSSSGVNVTATTITCTASGSNTTPFRRAVNEVFTAPGSYTIIFDVSGLSNIPYVGVNVGLMDTSVTPQRAWFDPSVPEVANEDVVGSARISANGSGGHTCEMDFSVTSDGAGNIDIFLSDLSTTIRGSAPVAGDETATIENFRVIEA